MIVLTVNTNSDALIDDPPNKLEIQKAKSNEKTQIITSEMLKAGDETTIT